MLKLLVFATAGVAVAGGLSTPAFAATPDVVAVTPGNGTTGNATTVHPTATFGAAINPTSLRYSFVKTVGGADVSGYTRYDAATKTVTFTPRGVLTSSTRYTITIKLKDASGVLSSPYIWSFTVGSVSDTAPPTRPGTPVAGAPDASSATLTWGASTDNVGVTAYQLFNGASTTPIATVTGAPPVAATTLTGLTPATTYSITVKAMDAAGNLSPASDAVTFTTAAPPAVPDTTPPTVPGTPTVGAVTATTADLTWTPSTDAVGVVAYEVSGGPSVVTTTTPAVTLTGLTPSTTYTITVKALDAADNVSDPSGAAVFTTPSAPLKGATSGAGIPGTGGRTLVVYDSTGPYAFLGEQYAILTANLASHFGDWTAQPAADYSAGELASFSAVVYVGSTYDEPLPIAFLDDIAATTKPVIWMYDNIWQLTARAPGFAADHGFTWTGFDFAAVSTVDYKGKAFTRDPQNGAGIMDTSISDPAKATPVGQAVRADGTTMSWGVRSGNFTYLGEIPYAYMTADDRYVAFADLLIDVLAPATPVRHRALVRLEDVGPDADPAQLRAMTNYLYSKGVPFSVAVYPRYRDPNGANSSGSPEDYTLAQRPQVVAELKYMQSHGGTLLMHGYTHQYSNVPNPYNGVSADDFEFYRAHIDDTNTVVYDGPVSEDSQAWAQGRINDGLAAFTAAGLAKPTMFEFPHYAGSGADNKAVAASFQVRYDRGLYPSGVLSGGTLDYSRIVGQFFPYTVRDIYGVLVVPENLGNVELEWYNNHPPRLPADILATAQLNTAVRDGVASFFFHPYLDVSYLKTIVEGVQADGYTFVPASGM
ncbi:DUF2334 domain-containing protein [Planosporangium thailandense]|nr:DUF2334 domain-containing protein [Planosporangium thailandense]